MIETVGASLGVYPIDNIYILYKRVKKISDGKYLACYDSRTEYKDGEITEVKDFDSDVKVSCGKGIHVSTPFYYQGGDTLIQVKVNVEDVITCLEGKLRCKKVTTIGEVKF